MAMLENCRNTRFPVATPVGHEVATAPDMAVDCPLEAATKVGTPGFGPAGASLKATRSSCRSSALPVQEHDVDTAAAVVFW